MMLLAYNRLAASHAEDDSEPRKMRPWSSSHVYMLNGLHPPVDGARRVCCKNAAVYCFENKRAVMQIESTCERRADECCFDHDLHALKQLHEMSLAPIVPDVVEAAAAAVASAWDAPIRHSVNAPALSQTPSPASGAAISSSFASSSSPDDASDWEERAEGTPSRRLSFASEGQEFDYSPVEAHQPNRLPILQPPSAVQTSISPPRTAFAAPLAAACGAPSPVASPSASALATFAVADSAAAIKWCESCGTQAKSAIARFCGTCGHRHE
jgi:hypothetical protein